MGTGGNKPLEKKHVELIDFLNRSIHALDGEIPQTGLSQDKSNSFFRNTAVSGKYTIQYDHHIYEIDIKCLYRKL